MNKALKLLLAAFLLGVLQMLFIGLWLRYQWSVFLLIGVEIASGVADSVCICIAAVLVGEDIARDAKAPCRFRTSR